MGAAKKTAAGQKPAAVPVGTKPRPNAAVENTKKTEKPLRLSQCRKHLRKTVAEAFRDIVDGFVAEAKRGGCQHVKMATEIVKMETPRARRSRTKGSAELLMEKYGGEFGYLPEDHPLRIAEGASAD